MAVAEVEVAFLVGSGHDIGTIAANQAYSGVAGILLGLRILDRSREGEQDGRFLEIVDVVQASAVATVGGDEAAFIVGMEDDGKVIASRVNGIFQVARFAPFSDSIHRGHEDV